MQPIGIGDSSNLHPKLRKTTEKVGVRPVTKIMIPVNNGRGQRKEKSLTVSCTSFVAITVNQKKKVMAWRPVMMPSRRKNLYLPCTLIVKTKNRLRFAGKIVAIRNTRCASSRDNSCVSLTSALTRLTVRMITDETALTICIINTLKNQNIPIFTHLFT